MKLLWLEGEQAAWAGKPGRLSGDAADRAFDLLLDELGKKQPLRASELARFGDDKLAEIAPELGPTTCSAAVMKLFLGRLGEGFVEHAVSLVRLAPRELMEAAMPIESDELVKLAATALQEQELPSEGDANYAPTAAERWLVRHASFATSVLGLEEAHACARAYLASFAETANPALAMRTARGALEPKEPPPVRAALPEFFDVAKLPRPVLKDGGAPLSDDEMLALGDQLRASSIAHPHADVAKLRFRCERTSLDAFVVGLLDAWCEAGTPQTQSPWPLEACAALGGDDAARAVAKRVRAWTRSRGYFDDDLAKAGCNVLAAQAQHGLEIARVLLDEIARTGGRAREEASKLAGIVDVTSHEAAKIPTLGLDATGSLAFDLGSVTYRVVFDESLVAHLLDDSGASVAAFPRLRKDMDAKAWETAKAIYAGIVKDAKTIARHELALLEKLMCDQEALPLASFRERYVEHPLLRHLGRRLVWSSGATFRIAEDGTFADVRDEAFTPGADVKVAHPVLMSADELRRWSERFTDYQILQPFPQLAREIFVASEAGGLQAKLPSGTKTTRGRIFQLVARGWQLHYNRIELELPDGESARIVFYGRVGSGNEENVVEGSSWPEERTLSKVVFSELMRDAHRLSP